ncbi:MAG: hypothetical protein IT326_07410 [Anaerolineae bacterium]|nr:hypothetical protein [Anaerolineae bacterium]
MLSIIVYLLPFVSAVMLLIAVLGAAFSFRFASKARYFRVRRAATERAWRWVLAGVISLALGAIVLLLRDRVPPPEWAFLSRAPAETPTLAVPPTLLPTEASILPASPTPEPPAADVTLTPGPDGTPIIVTIDSPVTPPIEAALTLSTISSGISANQTPIDEGNAFTAGLPRVYYWVTYTGLADGSSWAQVLLRDGEVIRSESSAWSRGASGLTYFWFEAQGGWPAGRYEVRFYVGDRLMTGGTYDLIN